MALEVLNLLKNKYFVKDTSNSERLLRNKVRKNLEKMLAEQLTSPNSIFEFEVTNQNWLNPVIAVIDEPPLVDKYLIVQSSDVITLFTAKEKEVEGLM